MLRHYRSHLQPITCPLGECKETFISRFNLFKHFRMQQVYSTCPREENFCSRGGFDRDGEGSGPSCGQGETGVLSFGRGGIQGGFPSHVGIGRLGLGVGGGAGAIYDFKMKDMVGPMYNLPSIDLSEKKFSSRNKVYIGNLKSGSNKLQFV